MENRYYTRSIETELENVQIIPLYAVRQIEK